MGIKEGEFLMKRLRDAVEDSWSDADTGATPWGRAAAAEAARRAEGRLEGAEELLAALGGFEEMQEWLAGMGPR